VILAGERPIAGIPSSELGLPPRERPSVQAARPLGVRHLNPSPGELVAIYQQLGALWAARPGQSQADRAESAALFAEAERWTVVAATSPPPPPPDPPDPGEIIFDDYSRV
jgi:hypothetical protein